MRHYHAAATDAAAEYDALIVGARVAGSNLAIRLAQQGRRVLVIDRDSFPSDTISTHFMDRLRHALVAQLYEEASDQAPATA